MICSAIPIMSPAELREILRKTQEIVRDATRWTERNFAEDERGKWTPVGSQAAVRFNLAGAMIKCSGASAREALQAVAELLSQVPARLQTEEWRHTCGLTRTHALELLEWALERLDSLGSEERIGAKLQIRQAHLTPAKAG